MLLQPCSNRVRTVATLCHSPTIKLSLSSTADQECLAVVVKVIMSMFALLWFYIVKFFLAAFHVWEIKVIRLCRGLGLLLVGPYVLVFVCSDMKGLQACVNSRLCRLVAEQHVLQQLLV